MELTGIVRVQPGNTVNISFGEDAASSRQFGFEIAKTLLAANAKGFDKGEPSAAYVAMVNDLKNAANRHGLELRWT